MRWKLLDGEGLYPSPRDGALSGLSLQKRLEKFLLENGCMLKALKGRPPRQTGEALCHKDKIGEGLYPSPRDGALSGLSLQKRLENFFWKMAVC